MGEALITRRGGGGGKKTIQGSITSGGNNGVSITFPLSGTPLGAYASEIRWRTGNGVEYRISPTIGIKKTDGRTAFECEKQGELPAEARGQP